MVLPPYLAVVDDDESVAKALKRLLKSLPWDVRTFGSSRDFLRAIAQRLPELAILDVQMPELSGLDLQEHIRIGGWSFPIIFITAFDDEEIRRHALERGAVGFIAKPFNKGSILELVGAARKDAVKQPTAMKLRLQPSPVARNQVAPAQGHADFELSDLQPCPFCCAYPRIDKIPYVDKHGKDCYRARVACPRCHAEVASDPDRGFANAVSAANDAMNRWNRRQRAS